MPEKNAIPCASFGRVECRSRGEVLAFVTVKRVTRQEVPSENATSLRSSAQHRCRGRAPLLSRHAPSVRQASILARTSVVAEAFCAGECRLVETGHADPELPERRTGRSLRQA